VGTPSYMAPEQVRGSSRTDHRADVWGLGVVMYRVLAGALPFQGRTFEELGGAILTQPPPPLPATTPRGEPIPAPLRTLVEACLQKSAERRPQTMAEVCTALDGVLADWLPATQPPAKVHCFPKPSRPVWPFVELGLGGTLALAGTGGLLFVWSRLTASPAPTASATTATATTAAAAATTPAPLAVPRVPPGEVEAPAPAPAPAAAAPRTLALDSRPSGARVVRTRDGRELGRPPLELAAPSSGELSLMLTLPGHQDTVVRLRPDSSTLPVVQLTRLPPPAPKPATTRRPAAKAPQRGKAR